MRSVPNLLRRDERSIRSSRRLTPGYWSCLPSLPSVPQRGQSGFSLIEILVGIMIMVPLTLASVSGALLQVHLSARSHQTQALEARLTSVTEDLSAVPFLSCGDADKYQELLRSWDDELAAKVVSKDVEPVAKIDSVEYWNTASATFSPKCDGIDAAQRLTVTVIGAGGVTATGSVVKRDEAVRSEARR